jgi:hypothetical protein
MKKSTSKMIFLFLALCALPAMADQAGAIQGKLAAAGVSTKMTVTRVDQESREVVLRSADGEESLFVAGPEVRNLAQVEAGDVVTITYAEGVAVRVYPVSAAIKGRVEKKEVSRAPLGAKPYGMVTRHIEIIGEVEALDRETRVATLVAKRGSLTLRVADDVDLSAVAVGDRVRVDYLERLTISVDAPAN